jgi:hypothetical protein
MLRKLPTAVKTIGKRRSVTGRGFGLRLAFADRFAAMIECPRKMVRPPPQPDRYASRRVGPDLCAQTIAGLQDQNVKSFGK